MRASQSPASHFLFQPGDFVSLPYEKDWGMGQVQSVIGNRVTVNFEHAGKQVIDMRHAHLEKTQPH